MFVDILGTFKLPHFTIRNAAGASFLSHYYLILLSVFNCGKIVAACHGLRARIPSSPAATVVIKSRLGVNDRDNLLLNAGEITQIETRSGVTSELTR